MLIIKTQTTEQPNNFITGNLNYQYFSCICSSSEPPHDKTNKMACAPSEDRSAWAAAQSEQSLRCPHEGSFGP